MLQTVGSHWTLQGSMNEHNLIVCLPNFGYIIIIFRINESLVILSLWLNFCCILELSPFTLAGLNLGINVLMSAYRVKKPYACNLSK